MLTYLVIDKIASLLYNYVVFVLFESAAYDYQLQTVR